MASSLQARKQFEALFTSRQPTREEMFMRQDFQVLAAMTGLSLGECWDALVKKASASKFGGNLNLAAEDWYGQVSAPRF